MSVETAPRPTADTPETSIIDHVPSTEELVERNRQKAAETPSDTSLDTLNAMFDAQAEGTEAPNSIEAHDDREISPIASSLNRLASAMDRFALSRARRQAVREDNSRTRTAQSEAFDSYAENIDTTQNRENDELEYSNDREVAYEQNEQFDANAQSEAFDSYAENIDFTQNRERAERKAQQKEAFEQAILEAKTALKRTGRSALKHTVSAGVTTLGVGLIAGETVAKTTVAAAEKTKSALELGIGMGLNATDAAAEKTAQFIDKGEDFARGAVEKGKDLANGAVETGKEAFMSYRDKLIAKAVAAGVRKDARRTRWAGKRAEYKARGHEAIDTTKEKGRNGIGRLHAARAAGGAALSAIASAKAAASSTYSTHIDQNRS